jgi:hypothetical protein
MKNLRPFLCASLALVAAVAALATAPIPGPRGGKIVTTSAPHVEFFVQPDRTVLVSFYDASLKPVPAGERVVSAIAEAKSGKVPLTFTTQAGALISSTPLPEGDGYRVVLQVRESATAKPRNYRLDYHAEACGNCQRAEYACICEDHGDEGHAHKH